MPLGRRALLGSGTAALLAAAVAPAARAAVRALDFASALDAAAAIRRRRISSVELTRAMLDRIGQHNRTLNAVVTVLSDSALARAKEADAATGKGHRWGALHGVPIVIKDSFCIAGVRTTAGVEEIAKQLPDRDAEVVARLRAAGAVILGNTNVPFLLSDWQSYNSIYGTSNNPWDRTRTPGGSSGGSAAALAAGLGYLSVGSDLGGSIRVPAHFCGVYGHKPSLGVVPMVGHVPPPPGTPPGPAGDLSVAGPMARTADDLEAAMKILGGPAGDEALAYRWTLPPPRRRRIAEYRLGCVLDDPLCPVSRDVKEVLQAAVEALRKAGVRVDEGWPEGVVPRQHHETYRYLLRAMFAGNLRDQDLEKVRAEAARPDGGIEAIEARAWVDPHSKFRAANRQRVVARRTWQQYFKEHDAFLLPTAIVPAFPHDHSEPSNARKLATTDGPRPYGDLFFWISLATLAGLPATTAPVGFTRSALPVGIQIVGPYLEDATPIDVARKLAGLIGGFRAPPGYGT